MEGNSSISGNTGGGVFVAGGGTFYMNGGSIFGNEALDGGGVLVNSGTFYMNGGSISGNISNSDGGGVYVEVGGTFYMNGGAISGNTTTMNGGGVTVAGTFCMINGTIVGNSDYNGLTKNTISLIGMGSGGAALYISSGSATYGPNGTENDILPATTDITDATIRVVNGVMQ